MKRVLLILCAVLALFAGIAYASAPNETGQDLFFSEWNPFYGEDPFYSEAVQAMGDREDFGYSPEIPYRDTLEEAAADLRGRMTDRENTVVIGFRTDREWDWSDLSREIFAMAVDHTGVPTEGDSLAWAWQSRDIRISVDVLEDVNYVTVAYHLQYYTTAEMERELDGAVEELLCELDLWGKSDYEKIKGIYDYICDHVKYDTAHANQSSYTLKYTPYAALIRKTAVCQGFALLYYRLACELDVDTRVIFGTSSRVNHVWMIVRLGDSYFYLDPTWDRGKTEYNYFLKGEAGFQNHTRMDNPLCGMYYTSSAFYGAYPVGAWDFSVSDIPEEGLTGTCGEGVFWRLAMDGRMTVYGEGEVEPFTETEAPWEVYAPYIREIVIDKGICGIGDGAFYSCTEVETVSLPRADVAVGENAFSELTEVLYAEKNSLTWMDTESGRTAESADGTRYAVLDRIPSDLIALGQCFRLEGEERIRFVSADGSRQLVRADGVKVGIRVQLLDENGGVADELTVALWGDFDLDGALTDSDAIVLLWSFLKPESYSYVPQYDSNGDGLVNASDAAWLGK